MWLASVWVARDCDTKQKGTRVRIRNKTAINFMQRWRKRLGEVSLKQLEGNNREEEKEQGEEQT
jgi:hypothetical protein